MIGVPTLAAVSLIHRTIPRRRGRDWDAVPRANELKFVPHYITRSSDNAVGSADNVPYGKSCARRLFTAEISAHLFLRC